MKQILYYLNHLSTMAILIVIAVTLCVSIIQFLALSGKYKYYYKIIAVIIIHIAVFLFFTIFFKYNVILHTIIFVFSAVLTAILLLLTNTAIFNFEGKIDPIWSVRFPVKNAPDLIIKNIKRGMGILGSSGSGKTESGFVPIIKHTGERDIPCLCYDYKDGELTEIALYLYQNSNVKFATIIPHNPRYSDRVNPFLPKYIKSEGHLRQMTKLIFANLKKVDNVKESGSSFFDKIPEPTLAAVIWRLKVDYPEYCTLPHAVAFCLTQNPMDIAEFISKNAFARVLGAPLIDSLASEDQVTGVKASLSLPLTDLALPNIFWIMSANEVDLDVNNPDNPTFLSIVNSPLLERTNAPFVSIIFAAAINSMQVRKRPPSFLLMDEGTTFTIDGISKIPATMRSFNIATVFSTQDKALSKESIGETVTNSLFANLSYLMAGKANDPESVKYYKQISEEIEKKTVSKSFSNTLLTGDTRISEGTRETSKYKNQDFTRLGEGQFFIFADGREQLYQLELYPFERIELKVKHYITEKDINDNFDRIMEEVKNLT